MLNIAKFLAILVVITGLVLWGKGAISPLPRGGIADVPEALVATPLPAADDGPVMIEGMVVLSTQAPDVPYIEYADASGDMRTKQLIISGGRGCSPAAGDLPCADGDSGDYPTLTAGEQIRIRGTIVGDQIFVSRLERR